MYEPEIERDAAVSLRERLDEHDIIGLIIVRRQGATTTSLAALTA